MPLCGKTRVPVQSRNSYLARCASASSASPPALVSVAGITKRGLAMSQFPRSLRLLALSLLATLMPICATADHFKFTVLFIDGSLFGNFYDGYFQTSKAPPGQFNPDAHVDGQLVSLAISIDGAQFLMQ